MFIFRMKHNVQKAILDKDTGKQAEDTTVSNDGMKIALEINLDDESKWLFDQVLKLHATKVTWRQIREYLKKTLSIKQEIRDSFEDQEIGRKYEEKEAEIIDDISQTVEKAKENSEMQNKAMMGLLKEMQAQMIAIKQQNEDLGRKMIAIEEQNETLRKEVESLKK